MYLKAAYPLVFVVIFTATLVIGTPLHASEADGEIVSAFNNTYVYKTYLKDDAIKISSKDGAVTLSGTVADDSHKTLAQETAASLPGVIGVDNQLATKAEVTAENADVWIGRKVKTVLLFRRNVSFGKTDVSVQDGIVTLKGTASSIAQKELTGEYAKDIEGVKGVNNEMTVAETPELPERTAGEKIDDASVTAQVKTTLLTHRSTSSVKTKVATRSGVVTLTGIANNAAEKALVTKLVNDIQGVDSVNNEMTVK